MAKFLFVDDNKQLIEIYKIWLTGFPNVDFDLVTSGLDAIEKMQHNKYDAAFIDIMMPKMSGWELIDYIKRSDNLKLMPVIVISALGNDLYEKSIEKGAMAFLEKPISLDSMTEILNILNR